MKQGWALLVAGWAGYASGAAEIRLNLGSDGAAMVMVGGLSPGACFLESAPTLSQPFHSESGRIVTTGTVAFPISSAADARYFRAHFLDWNHPQSGFTQFIRSYATLTTLAGAGGSGAAVNKWSSAFEGGAATNAALSRPHIALGDDAGNIYIADKEGHAIRVVTPDGLIRTHAGMNFAGNGPDTTTPAREVALNQPNGCWVRGDGTVYILDLGNGKVRRVDTHGMCETLFVVPGGISTGRGLWVRDDESVAYLCSGSRVKKWTRAGGVMDVPGTFIDLGNLAMSPEGRLIVTDRGAHRVWWLSDEGVRTLAAGNGATTGGGEGARAVDTGLNEVRGVWVMPHGGLLLSTAAGSQVWYVDAMGIIHLLVHGLRGSDTHAGDGAWFYDPMQARLSETRSVTMDRQGNILITENDRGYIRRIRLAPFDR